MVDDEAGSYITSWLSQAAEHSASNDHSHASSWPARFDRLWTARLSSQLQAEQFCTLSDVAGLLPGEVQELDNSLSLQAASAVIEVASRLAEEDICEAVEQTCSSPSFSLLSNRVQACKLQPIQVQCSSLILTATEQKALPTQGKDWRQYFLVLLWFVFMVIGFAGLLWSSDVASDPNAAKAGFSMRFSTMSIEQLAPRINTFKRWVERHNFNVAGNCRFWEVQATSLLCWFNSLVGRRQTEVHNILRPLTWWRAHVGVQFPILDAILAGWQSTAGPGLQQPKEVAPLQLQIFLRLVDVSAASFGAIAQFCSFALVILASCLQLGNASPRKCAHCGLPERGKVVNALCGLVVHLSCLVAHSGECDACFGLRNPPPAAGLVVLVPKRARSPCDWCGREVLAQDARSSLCGRGPFHTACLYPHCGACSYRACAECPDPEASGVQDEDLMKERSKFGEEIVSYSPRRLLPSCADFMQIDVTIGSGNDDFIGMVCPPCGLPNPRPPRLGHCTLKVDGPDGYPWWCGEPCVRIHDSDRIHRGECRCETHFRNRYY